MCCYILLFYSLFMVYLGIFHWPDKPKKELKYPKYSNSEIIDAQWEEYDPNKSKVDKWV